MASCSSVPAVLPEMLYFPRPFLLYKEAIKVSSAGGEKSLEGGEGMGKEGKSTSEGG